MIVGGKKKSGETCREIKWVQEASHGSLSIGHLVQYKHKILFLSHKALYYCLCCDNFHVPASHWMTYSDFVYGNEHQVHHKCWWKVKSTYVLLVFCQLQIVLFMQESEILRMILGILSRVSTIYQELWQNIPSFGSVTYGALWSFYCVCRRVCSQNRQWLLSLEESITRIHISSW